MSSRTFTRLVFVAGLVAWIAGAILMWLSSAPLGHDEAQYAIAAKDLLAGDEPRWFYLSTGMNAVAVPGILGGGSERALHALPLVFGIGFVLAVAQLAWQIGGATTAAWVVAILAGMRPLAKWSTELSSDLPATALLVAATSLIVAEVVRADGPRWRLVLAGPLLAAAFYLRYASCVPIAIVGTAALALGWRGIARRPGPGLAALLVFAALLVPHAISAIRVTGSPLGLLLESGGVVPREHAAEGLIEYLTSNPFLFYGILAPPVMLAGVLALRRGADRRLVFLVIVALAQVAALGLTTHARVRYIFFAVALLVIAGTDVLRRTIAARAPRTRNVVVAACAVAVLTSWAMFLSSASRHGAARRRSTKATLDAAEVIRKDAAGIACHVLGARYTQLEYYSGCRSDSFDPAGVLARGERVYVVNDYTPNWRPFWQPDVTALPGRRHVLLDVPGRVQVTRLD